MPKVYVGQAVEAVATAEASPTLCEWRWYAPGEPSGGPADATGFTAIWIPDQVGVWTLHATVFYAHEWPAGQLYRTNAVLDVLVIDAIFVDGFESGDTSAWSNTVT